MRKILVPLVNATGKYQSFTLDALGATIIAQGDGAWELELSLRVPLQIRQRRK